MWRVRKEAIWGTGQQDADSYKAGLTHQQQSQTGNRVLVLTLSVLILPQKRTLDPQDGSGDTLAQTHVEVLLNVSLNTWADEIAWFRIC